LQLKTTDTTTTKHSTYTRNHDFCNSQDARYGRLRAAHWLVRVLPLGFLTLLTPGHRFIDNEFVKGVDGKTFEVINPATEEVICSVAEATEKDVDVAVKAARTAFESGWRKVTPGDRSKLLFKLGDLFERDIDILASIESLDNGKAITMARGDVAACAACLKYYGGWADKIEGKVIDTGSDTFNYVRKEPVSFFSTASKHQ
jgi:acyl-CoA reductase-like NAD-dependent aldehyde dehydrogenase